MVGGDKEWLCKGLKAVPKKLQMIAKLNWILAYRPWSLASSEVEYVKSLLHAESKEDRWSSKELLHAGMILILFHGFSGLINAC